MDLDQLFNTLDERTRAALQDVIKGQATIYTGNNAAARRTYKYFAPGLQATERLLAELTRDQASLSRFLVDGSTALGAIAERRDDLAALTSNANEALGAIAARNEEFDRALVALPPAMLQANTTFVNLRAALDDLDPLIQDLGAVAPDLPAFLRLTRETADPAGPVFANLTQAIARPGKANDLTDSLRTPRRRSARRVDRWLPRSPRSTPPSRTSSCSAPTRRTCSAWSGGSARSPPTTTPTATTRASFLRARTCSRMRAGR